MTDGDQVATWAVLSGTHEGEYNGVPPTGRKLEWRQVGYTRVVDGKVVEYEGMAELPSVLLKLGVIAPVDATDD
jgi:predicted ester cyclase